MDYGLAEVDEETDQVHKHGLPHPQLKLVHEVYDQHDKEIELEVVKEARRERILERPQESVFPDLCYLLS